MFGKNQNQTLMLHYVAWCNVLGYCFRRVAITSITWDAIIHISPIFKNCTPQSPRLSQPCLSPGGGGVGGRPSNMQDICSGVQRTNACCTPSGRDELKRTAMENLQRPTVFQLGCAFLLLKISRNLLAQNYSVFVHVFFDFGHDRVGVQLGGQIASAYEFSEKVSDWTLPSKEATL